MLAHSSLQNVRTSRPACAHMRGGFTYVEMLVVLIIIGLLVAISLQVGRAVSEGGRLRQTEATLRVLDQSLTTYLAENPGQFPAEVIDARGEVYPIIDGRCMNAWSGDQANVAPAWPSLGLYLSVVTKNGKIAPTITGLDPSLIRTVNFASEQPGFTQPEEQVAGNTRQQQLFTVLDGWGRPFRFVHPKYDGGYGDVFKPVGGTTGTGFTSVGRGTLEVQLQSPSGTRTVRYRRSAMPFNPDGGNYTAGDGSGNGAWVGDADEGLCAADRPYFYSAGPDGNPGTRGDNVYSVKPSFPAESGTSGQ
jgi:prepilin-type N-terminal cleavage/methylation domain-containing protein